MYSRHNSALGTVQPKLLTVLPGEITSGRLLGLNTIRKLKGEGGREVIVSPGIHRKFRCLIRTEEAVGRTTPLSCEQFED